MLLILTSMHRFFSQNKCVVLLMHSTTCLDIVVQDYMLSFLGVILAVYLDPLTETSEKAYLLPAFTFTSQEAHSKTELIVLFPFKKSLCCLPQTYRIKSRLYYGILDRLTPPYLFETNFPPFPPNYSKSQLHSTIPPFPNIFTYSHLGILVQAFSFAGMCYSFL